MAGTIACDFFTVPTMTFRNLFVFVVLHHGSRQILHVNVTEHPTAESTARQLVEALGGEDAPEEVTRLLRDRDGVYGKAFQRQVKALARFLANAKGGSAALLNPGAHRVRSGVVWVEGRALILDSFSGFWRKDADEEERQAAE